MKFILHRMASGALIIAGLLTLVFVMAHLAPGDPAALKVSPAFPQAVARELTERFKLDQPVPAQYLAWVGESLRGNLGISMTNREPVAHLIANCLPNTAILALIAIAMELVAGIVLGMLSVRYDGRTLGRCITTGSLIVVTLPTFWIGLMLLTVVSSMLGLLPSSQMFSIDSDGLPVAARAFDFLKHLVLPAMTVALPGAAAITRYFRESLLHVRGQEYVTYARSFGLSPKKLFVAYELPNALGPVITLVGLEFGTLLTGALVTEMVFAWPGMGRLAVLAILSRDYPLMMGCTLVAGVVVVAGNFLSDVISMAVDPRVRWQT